jgi:hypothetical protein
MSRSFMILTHPHFGVNPVTIYERMANGQYSIKIDVTIVSLLHDFMRLHPNIIQLKDIRE